MTLTVKDLPGLDCGACGYRTCATLAEQLPADPELLKRCIYYSDKQKVATPTPVAKPAAPAPAACNACAAVSTSKGANPWQDSLGRDVDF